LTFIRRENFSPFRLAPILLFILLVFFLSLKIFFKGGDIMKKIAIELLIIAATVMVYVMPVLADSGGW
jgi:hypothetical protein